MRGWLKDFDSTKICRVNFVHCPECASLVAGLLSSLFLVVGQTPRVEQVLSRQRVVRLSTVIFSLLAVSATVPTPHQSAFVNFCHTDNLPSHPNSKPSSRPRHSNALSPSFGRLLPVPGAGRHLAIFFRAPARYRTRPTNVSTINADPSAFGHLTEALISARFAFFGTSHTGSHTHLI